MCNTSGCVVDGLGVVSGPQTAFRLTRAHREVSVICNLIARLQKSDTKKEKGKGSEDLRLALGLRQRFEYY